MGSTTLSNKNIEKSFSNILVSLSEKEKWIIEMRVWLRKWKKETLQDIWKAFTPHITRERVRQIEETWVKKIWRIIKGTILTTIQEKWIEFIELNGWVVSKDDLVNYLIRELDLERDVNKWILETVMQSDYEILKSKQKLGCKIFFYKIDISKSSIEKIHKEALKILKKKKDVMEKKEIFEAIKKSFPELKLSSPLINSILGLFDDIIYWEEDLVWLTKWRILNPKTLKDKAVYVMKKEWYPMHFIEVSNKIMDYLWEVIKVNTVHNELIRNEDFVLIWRWIYALKSWWFKPGTVIDVICSVMEKHKEPMSTKQVVKEVLKVRDVKTTTIYMNLQNRQVFDRVWRNLYQLKDKEVSL